MQKREQAVTPRILKWCAHNMELSFAGEIKVVNSNRYNYNSDKSLAKEIRNLKLAGGILTYKISDASTFGTPFDFFQLHSCPGFFFFYWKRRGNKQFYIIEVSALEREIKSEAKSLTEERAKEIGLTCELL